MITNKLGVMMIHSNKEKREFLLLGLLEKFTKKELKGLRDFVSCRYFNTDQYVVKLLEVLENELTGKSAMDETIQAQIHTRVFGKKQKATLNKKQKATFNAKMNALTRLAERFLTVEALEDDEAYKSDLLLKKLLEKRQSRLFDRQINKLQKNRTERRGTDYHNRVFKILRNELQHIYLKGKIGKTDNLNEQNQQLDLYYLLHKLGLMLTAYELQGKYTSKYYDFLDAQITNNLIKNKENAKHPLVSMYHAAINLSRDQNQITYDRLFDLFDEYEVAIPVNTRHFFYVVLTNFCAAEIKKGNTEYYKQAYELYRMMDSKNLLLENNIMPPGKLKNIVSTAGRVGQHTWAEKMIEKYTPHVNKNMREDIYNFNLGAIAFYQKNYDATKEYFSKINNRINPIYDISLRIITAKYTYELSRNDNKKYDTYSYTLPRLQSYEGYISESKSLKKNDKESHKNFMRMLINLYRIKHSEGKMTLKKVKEKLTATTQISNKDWLQEKIYELEIKPPKPI